MLIRIIPASTLPVSIEVAKDRCHVDDDDSDLDIELLIKAATGAIEKHCGIVLQPSTWEQRYDCWPWATCWNTGAALRLGLAPVRTVDSIKYLDDDGAEQTVDADDWYWNRTPDGADIGFASGWSAPALYQRPGAVRVRFTAGYNDEHAVQSDSELTIPPEVQMTVLFLVGAWIENREAVIAEQKYEVPATFKFLADQLKVYR